MVREIARIGVVLVNNETESLLLENNLIEPPLPILRLEAGVSYYYLP